ncbi:MAG: NAD(P)H-dependent oxidoreductase [Cyanobacteriota bacterium]|nr:NAD(P)H-dependent oxidoreductase [Cyanobacteriota bacterium]
MNVLIVYAHPEPKSFCAALKNLAVSALTEAGHNVQVSDLHTMNFQAVATKEDFLELDNQDFFKYQVEQKIAYENEKLAPDIVAEQEKLLWADFVILNFPLWWFSVPAIMKGWVDRVFTTGFAYGGGKMYDRGGLKGKKAMLSLTTGGPATMYSSTGLNGDIGQILFPINHGILYFVGMQVLPPFIAWAPARVGDEGRQKYLQEYKERLLSLDYIEPLKYPPLSDYDEEFKLKSQ